MFVCFSCRFVKLPPTNRYANYLFAYIRFMHADGVYYLFDY